MGYPGVITDVTEEGTKEVKEVQQDVKTAHLLTYILKPPFITHIEI